MLVLLSAQECQTAKNDTAEIEQEKSLGVGLTMEENVLAFRSWEKLALHYIFFFFHGVPKVVC